MSLRVLAIKIALDAEAAFWPSFVTRGFSSPANVAPEGQQSAAKVSDTEDTYAIFLSADGVDAIDGEDVQG